jgi:hypothetical protein
MAVGLLCWLQRADAIQTADGIANMIGNDVIAPLLCEEFTLFRTAIATDAGRVATPTNDHRDNVLRTRQRAHALNHGGAID